MSHYNYAVNWSEEDGEYVATCSEFPSLCWIAPTPEKALSGLCGVMLMIAQELRNKND
jgi:predicted RNase H-like HicB family nuclease